MTQPSGWGPPDESRPPAGNYGGPPPGYYGGPPPGYYGGPPPGYYGAPPPGYYGPGFEAPRPGCVPLRPLGVGDILDGAFKVIRRDPRVMLGLSAGFAFVQVALTTLITLVVFNNLADVNTQGDNVNVGPLLGNEGLQILTLFVTGLLGAVLTGMLTIAVTQDVLGRKVDIAAVWTQVRPRLWTLIALAVVTTVLEFLGVVAGLVPGVWLWGIWAVAVPACMVERTGVGAALGRSRALVRGTFWRVWGIRALGYLVLQVVSSLIVLPFLLLGLLAGVGGLNDLINLSGTPTALVLITSIGSLIASTLTAPVRAAIDALLYVDLRMRKEGLDIVLQQAAVAAPPMTAG